MRIEERQTRLDWGNALAETANANQSKLIEENKTKREEDAAKKHYLAWYTKSTLTSLASN
jgi:hypothetical protein